MLTTIYLIGIILSKLQPLAVIILIIYGVLFLLTSINYVISMSDKLCCKEGKLAKEARKEVDAFYAPYWSKLKSKFVISLIVMAVFIKLLPTPTQLYILATLHMADKTFAETHNLNTKEFAKIIDLSIKRVKIELQKLPNQDKKQ